jgi:hypothetical protein
MNRPLTKKEWLASLQKAIDEFDWDAAFNNEPVMWERRADGKIGPTATPIQKPAEWLTEERYAQMHTAKRLWVGLTDEEKHKTWYEMQNIVGWYSFQEIANAIETKLKEKNT